MFVCVCAHPVFRVVCVCVVGGSPTREEARRTYGEVIPSHNPDDARLFALRQPVGVTAAITPWNFPLAMITRKAAAALAAGCVMVIKPSELTPLSALALAVLAERAGIPPGVLGFVTGDAAAIGGELTSNPAVRKLSFTAGPIVYSHNTCSLDSRRK